jgi:putative phosphoesterase
MRLAVISDIHGNFAALEAVLADAERRGITQYLCLGDVAATGPQPHEVVARLRQLGCPVVMGNTDAWLLDPPEPQPEQAERRPIQVMIEDIDRWGAGQLTEEDRRTMRAYQPTVALDLESVRLLAVHGSPRSFDEQMLATTTGEQLDEMLAGAHADIVVSGHTHQAMVRRHRAWLLVNPGSVGLPYDQVPLTYVTKNPLWAEYAVLTCERAGLGIELLRVGLAPEAVMAPALASGMPHAREWAADWA